VVVPLAALVTFWRYGTANTLLISASCLEAAALCGLGMQFLRYAER
jgi:hypothetical protein